MIKVFFSVFYLLGRRKIELKQPKGKQMAESFICSMHVVQYAQQAVGSSLTI